MSSNSPIPTYELSDSEKKLIGAQKSVNLIRAGTKKWSVPVSFKTYSSDIYNLKIREDDVWVLGQMRSGTTVTQEMVWLICNNLDFETTKTVLLRERFPSLEHILLLSYLVGDRFAGDRELITNSWKKIQNVSDSGDNTRRFIKTHLPLQLLPKNVLKSNCKKIYIVRDPKEVILSNFHTHKRYATAENDFTFTSFWNLYKKDLILWCPYFEHVKEAFALKDEFNILIIFYNDVINKQSETIRKVAEFLEKEVTDEQVEQIGDYLRNTIFHKAPMKSQEYQIETKAYVKHADDAWKSFFVSDLEQELLEWIEANTRNSNVVFSS